MSQAVRPHSHWPQVSSLAKELRDSSFKFQRPTANGSKLLTLVLKRRTVTEAADAEVLREVGVCGWHRCASPAGVVTRYLAGDAMRMRHSRGIGHLQAAIAIIKMLVWYSCHQTGPGARILREEKLNKRWPL